MQTKLDQIELKPVLGAFYATDEGNDRANTTAPWPIRGADSRSELVSGRFMESKNKVWIS